MFRRSPWSNVPATSAWESEKYAEMALLLRSTALPTKDEVLVKQNQKMMRWVCIRTSLTILGLVYFFKQMQFQTCLLNAAVPLHRAGLQQIWFWIISLRGNNKVNMVFKAHGPITLLSMVSIRFCNTFCHWFLPCRNQSILWMMLTILGIITPMR